MMQHRHNRTALPAPLPPYPSVWDQGRPASREPEPEPAELTAEEVAMLRPLGRRAVVHDMAERLGLPTPDRPHPTTTAEEARR